VERGGDPEKGGRKIVYILGTERRWGSKEKKSIWGKEGKSLPHEGGKVPSTPPIGGRTGHFPLESPPLDKER